MKKIVLCADDFGKNNAVSQGIVNLLIGRRITATSCLVNGPDWHAHAKLLQGMPEDISIGLHFNLTEGHALSSFWQKHYGQQFLGLKKLMLLSLTRTLHSGAVEAELLAQLDCFEATVGHVPTHIDGHQHVHQFPVVREALIKVCQQRQLNQTTQLRWVGGNFSLRELTTNFKKWVIFAMGSKAFSGLLMKNNFRHNRSFSGIYPFTQADNYRHWFQQFLSEVKTDGLIMTHAGFGQKNDEMGQVRAAEYTYLSSENYLLDLKNQQVELVSGLNT